MYIYIYIHIQVHTYIIHTCVDSASVVAEVRCKLDQVLAIPRSLWAAPVELGDRCEHLGEHIRGFPGFEMWKGIGG